jgi:hypothetical protein
MQQQAHLILEAFRIAAQYILGPMAGVWLAEKLKGKPKTRRGSARKSNR